MPSASRFILKSSHPAIKEVAGDKKVKGRCYDTECANRPGAIRAEEVLFGLQMACISITDNEPGTLANVGKANPWQIQSLKILTGSIERAHLPLEQLLKEDYDLELDHVMNISKMSKAGHFLDTQGFIAHNDGKVVLSFRCTTTAFDWMTNLTTTSSAWEPEKDVEQGHSGWFSSFDGMFGLGKNGDKPRVHTGFYNNFLVTVPLLQQYIDPLLNGEDEPPRTLYIVGHSLGGGVAAMAASYYLLNYKWEDLKHKLRIVTAGGPRAYLRSMRGLVDKRLRELRRSDKAVFARVVRDKDAVPTVPPEKLGFAHPLLTLVYISKKNAAGKNTLIINPNFDMVVPKKKMKELLEEHDDLLPEGATVADDESDDEKDDDGKVPTSSGDGDGMWDEDTDDPNSKYQKTIGMVPRHFRDHMPEFYLYPLYGLVEKEKA